MRVFIALCILSVISVLTAADDCSLNEKKLKKSIKKYTKKCLDLGKAKGSLLITAIKHI